MVGLPDKVTGRRAASEDVEGDNDDSERCTSCYGAVFKVTLLAAESFWELLPLPLFRGTVEPACGVYAAEAE